MTARFISAAALALLAAGAAFMFVAGVTFESDGESYWVHLEAFVVSSACVLVGSCAAIWGLARASRRAALAGAAGVAIGAAVFVVAAESQSPQDDEIAYFRVLWVLVFGLVVAVGVVARRLSSDARAAA